MLSAHQSLVAVIGHWLRALLVCLVVCVSVGIVVVVVVVVV